MVTASTTAFSQIAKPLPLDENGSITFSQVRTVPGACKQLLFANALSYVQSLYDDNKESKRLLVINTDSSELRLPVLFQVYHEFPIKSPHGLVKYQLTISLKEGRYRYVTSNFTFHYLKRNRYGKFVEVKGKSKAMESPLFKGNQKLWEDHKQQLHEKIESLAQTLDAYMNIPESTPEREIVKINSDW